MSKRDMIRKLYSDYMREFAENEIVVGEGNPNSKILLIGEAPGRDEVKLQRPFVGMAGKNLDEFLKVSGIERDSVYITNAIKYRLSKVNEKTGKLINRPATNEEISKNRQYLLNEIEIIRPEIIVTLGNVPLRAVLGDFGVAIGDFHGELRYIKVFENEYKLFPLYHPAGVIYNRALKSVYMDDLDKFKSVYRS